MHTIQCAWCGKEFQAKKKTRKFCGLRCSGMRPPLPPDSPKRCPACGESKPQSEYWKDKHTKSGLQSICKACSREMTRRYYATPEGRAKFREQQRRTRTKNRERRNAQNRAWSARNLERIQMANRARCILHRAIKAGKVIKATACQKCGADGVKIEAAHWDYSLPLDVLWLCIPCHRSWDGKYPKTKR